MTDYLTPYHDLTRYLPQYLTNKVNSSLLRNLFNRFLTKEEVLPLYGLIGHRTEDSSEVRPWVPQSTVERTVNELMPMTYWKVGAQEFCYGFSDVINKLLSAGIDVNNASEWSKAQSFNFAPPINLDKFDNFAQYYWVLPAIPEAARPTLAWNPTNLPEFYVIDPAGTSSWSTANYWVHKDDLDDWVTSHSIDKKLVVQALRPIIEYDADVEMMAGQVRSIVNQVPLFNIYYYDGTPTNKVSSIFFYAEDQTYSVDQYLFRRVKTNKSGNFIFSQGLIDADGRTLFYKKGSIIKSIWAPGPISAQASDPIVQGIGNGSLSLTVSQNAPAEMWRVLFIDDTNFTVLGSKSGVAHDGIVDVPLIIEAGVLQVTPGSIPFMAGDTITFNVYNVEGFRYVTTDGEGNIINCPVSPAQDDAGIGAWMTPNQLIANPYHENRQDILHGDLVNHFMTIISGQLDVQGSPFGRNNYRDIPHNHGLGGKIKDFNGAFNILLALSHQRDFAPTSIISFIETQYEAAINSLIDFVALNSIDFISNTKISEFTVIDPSADLVARLFAAYEENRTGRADIMGVYRDTTAPIANWPATLPVLGISPFTQPGIELDHELGIYIIRHHDSHVSPIQERNVTAEHRLVNLPVTRSDGNIVSGSSGALPPSQPYKNQLWFNSTTGTLMCFAVVSDLATPPSIDQIEINDFWYQRSTNTLYQWNGTTWALASINNAWVELNIAALQNSLILAAEQRIYNARNQVLTTPSWDAFTPAHLNKPLLEEELAKFAAKYNYDPYGIDYVDTDAFTWNYSASSLGIARWHQIYLSLYGTARPNLEPWKILNFATKPVNWDSTWANTEQFYDPSLTVAPVSLVFRSHVAGLFNITDGFSSTINGYSLSLNQRLLFVGQSDLKQNGIYRVFAINGSTATLVRADDANSINEVVTGLNVSVNGPETAWNGTVWKLTSNPSTMLDAMIYEQVRMWKDAMWVYIKTQNPSVKVCVNVHTDELLPPYVSPTAWNADDALLNVIPPGVANSYELGDYGPTELLWVKSIEFQYAIARIGFRLSPLEFLAKTWGNTVFSVDGWEFDRYLGKKLSHKEFKLHGESYTPPIRDIAQNITTDITEPFILKVVEVDNNVTVFKFSSNTLDAFIVEGQNAVLGTLGSLLIDDLGKPFVLNDQITFDGFDFTFTPFTSYRFNGLNQSFTNLLRYNSLDVNGNNYASIAFRNWDVKLGYRCDGMIETENLELSSDVYEVTTNARNVVFKQNPIVRESWLHAFRIQVVQIGSYALNSQDLYLPSTDGSDWKFRVETFNHNYPIIEYIQLNTAGNFQTFNALSKQHTDLYWTHYLDGETRITQTTPFVITGIQNLVNFLFGYVKRLEEDGWRFDKSDVTQIDDLTGRNLNWQLEIEKLIDFIYSGITAGQGHVLNPFPKAFWFETPTGLVSTFDTKKFADINGSQLVFDMLGQALESNALTVVREDDITMVASSVPIFSAHVHVDEYEHVVLFENYAIPSENINLIYDPFLSLIISKLLIKTLRQIKSTRRPTMGGFYLQGHDVKRNLEASVDNLAKYFDSDYVYHDRTTTQHAMALLGYHEKPYFDALDVSKSTQFHFWRGLIGAKGSNFSIDAFTNSAKFDTAELDEFWVYKVAEYGDSRQKSYPEIKLYENDCSLQTTRFQFFSEDEQNKESFDASFTRIDSLDDSRWFSIDDLNANVSFEADIAGTAMFNVLPSWNLIDRSTIGNGIFDVFDFYEVTKAATFTIRFDSLIDLNHFNVYEGTTLIGTGTIDELLILPDYFTISIKSGTQEFDAIDTIEFETIRTGIDAILPISFKSDAFTSSLVEPMLVGFGSGKLTNVTIAESVPYQMWTLRADTPTSFTLTGDVSGEVATSFGLGRFDNGLIKFDLVKGDIAFVAGDFFVFNTNAVTSLEVVGYGNLTNIRVHGPYAMPEVWQISMMSATEFSVAGSVSGLTNQGTVGTYYDNGKVGFLIESGLQSFTAGQTFKFNVNVQKVNSDTIRILTAGTVELTGYVPAKPKFSPIKLFDYKNQVLIEDISVWHPAFGAHNPTPLESVNIISATDLAKYNYSTLITDNPNYSTVSTWGEREVGKVWWDIETLDYVPYYDTSIFTTVEERLSRWGSLADYSDIKVYEWVQSDVPPAIYNEQAKQQEGKLEIESGVKKSGTVARPETYARTRIWWQRPVAWSRVPNPPPEGGVTQFLGASTKLFISDGQVTLDDGRFSDHGLIANVKIWGWEDNKPVGEATITGTISYDIGSSSELLLPETSDLPAEFDAISFVQSAKSSSVGNVIGPITFKLDIFDGTVGIIAVSNTISQRLDVEDFYGQVGSPIKYDFTDLGIAVILTPAVNQLDSLEIVQAITAGHDVKIREQVTITTHLAFSSDQLINDPVLDQTQWIAQVIPTQEQLTADLNPPINTWQPIYGDWIQMATTSDFVAEAVAEDKNPLTLATGEKINRIKSTWTAWSVLKHELQKKTGNNNKLTFTFTGTISPKRVSVYVNGILQLNSIFTVNDNTLYMNNETPAGQQVVVLHRKYVPTNAELMFDPDTKDDLMLQTHYKNDYQYVIVQQRDSEGTIIGNNYYFWVRNKAFAAPNNSMSVQQAEIQLRNGPDVYLTFHNLLPATLQKPPRYDSVSIHGLNLFVTSDNMYKLRFTEDFTLRDNPNELDLKNTHTEWTQIRPDQKHKIPKQLWDKLSDAACGQNARGDQIPSQNRIDYDARHGTRTRYGFNKDQIIVDTSLVLATLKDAILNTKLVKNVGGINIPDYIEALNFIEADLWFATPFATRRTLETIWRLATPRQINNLFFEVLNDALAKNFEFTDLFKTSRLAVHSVRTVSPQQVIPFNDY
ncbi:MAG: hypothetical protein QXN55_01805 [Candidatus Nitrosotenuis sp.]